MRNIKVWPRISSEWEVMLWGDFGLLRESRIPNPDSSLCTATLRKNQWLASLALKDSLVQECHSFLTQPGKSGCLAEREGVSISSWGVQQCRRI